MSEQDSKQPEQGSKELPEGYRPLSQAPEEVTVTDTGVTIRRDQMGRLLCHATRRDGEKCKSPAITGMRVCRMHGGSTQKAKMGAKLRLAELVMPAIGTLAREMATADKSADKQRAANSILDRAGLGRHSTVDIDEAKETLMHAILKIREQREAKLAEEAEEAEVEIEDVVDPMDLLPPLVQDI